MLLALRSALMTASALAAATLADSIIAGIWSDDAATVRPQGSVVLRDPLRPRLPAMRSRR